jgi:hypothetical protein
MTVAVVMIAAATFPTRKYDSVHYFLPIEMMVMVIVEGWNWFHLSSTAAAAAAAAAAGVDEDDSIEWFMFRSLSRE